MQLIDEIEEDKEKYRDKDISVIINQMRHAAADKEIKKYADKWFLEEEEVKYEAHNYKDGKLANENKLKESANYSAYKESSEAPLPKFKYYGELSKEFKEALMPEISPLIE